jgi:Tol biopolymer transport system component
MLSDAKARRSFALRDALIGLLITSLLVTPVSSQNPPATEAPKPDSAKPRPPALSLKPERKLEFTTNEATWLSLSLSPDGQTLLFDILGDIYTLPITGGTAKRITSGMRFDSQPVFSPDGKRMAYLTDEDGNENLWIADIDGSNPKQLSREQSGNMTSPAWMPDGEFVLVSKSSPATGGVHEIWMYHIRGGSGVQVTRSLPPGAPATPGPGQQQQRLNAQGAFATADGKFIYYARRTGNFTYNATFPLWQIVRRDRLTGDEDVITSAPGSAMRPVLSPDGKQLVFATRFDTETGLRIRDLTTGEERWLKYPVQRDDQESAATRDTMPGYVFTPDGKSVIASYGGRIRRIQVATGEVSEIPFTADVSLDLGPQLKFTSRVEEGPVRSRLIMQPAQSPDGSRLVFSSLTKLYVMPVSGGAPRRLTSTSDNEYQPAWSPDGEWIAYSTWAPDAGGHIYKVRADGSGSPQRLTTTAGFYRDPVWSPDGSRIVVLRGSRQQKLAITGFGIAGGQDVVWIPAAGGDATLIVPARGVGRPHFGPEKDRVYVNSPQGLQSFRFDGTDRRTHLRVTGRSRGPQPADASEIRISPSGNHALASLNNQIYLVTVPRIGGEAPSVNVDQPSVPVRKLTDIGADDFHWANDGRMITWALGSTFFRLPMDRISFDTPAPRPEGGAPGGGDSAATPAVKPPKADEVEVVIERPRAKPTGVVALRGAKLITMKGDEVIADGDIVIDGNRITAVGRRGSVPIPASARQIELKGMTVMPGIVDVHAHWLEIQRGQLDTQNWTFLANVAYGVTTGRDPQTGSNDMFAYQDLVETGDLIGPRAFSTGPGIFSNTNFQSLDDARNVVARYKKYYRTNTVKSYMVGNRKQRQWMIQACKEYSIMPTTEGGLDLKLNLTHAIDGFSGNEHSLPIVPLYKDVVETFAKSGIFYTPTLLVAYGGPWAENYFYETTKVYTDPKMRRFVPRAILEQRAKRRPWFSEEEHIFPKLAAQAAKIVRAGGRVCIGGHGQMQGIQCHWEMWALQAGGLSNHEVLRAATLHGAEAIGFDQDLGSIEPGKLADLVILNKDPLENIRNTTAIRYVMKNGELFEGDTLNQIWPVEKKLPELWWWKENP